MDNCCLRSLVTTLHILIGIGAGFTSVYRLLDSMNDNSCFPPLVNSFADPVEFRTGLPFLCNAYIYGLAAVGFFNLIMAVSVNCCWKSECINACNLMFTIVTSLMALFGGAAFSIFTMLWCDSLLQFYPMHTHCKESASNFDAFHKSKNLTAAYRYLQFEQIGIWSIVPLAAITTMAYLAISRSNASSTQDGEITGQVRYVLLNDENSPLLNGTHYENHGSESLPNPPPHTGNTDSNSTASTDDRQALSSNPDRV